MNNQPVFTCWRAIIHGMGRHDERVGYSDHLIFRRTDTGDKRSFLNNVPCSIIQLNPISYLERTHISNHQSGNDVADNRTRTEWDNQADKHRYSLKYSGVGTRQVGINHRNHKGIEQETDNMERRHCPIRIKAVDLKTPSLYFTCQIQHETHQIFHCIPDHNNGKQFRNVVNDTNKDSTNRIPDITEQTISQPFRLWENNKNQRYGKQ